MMPTATILGDTYDTVVMPDGKEWLKTNLRRADYGTIYEGDGPAETLAYGRNYIGSEVLGWSDFPDGWHVPSKAEWEGLFAAIGCTYIPGPGGNYWTFAGNKLKKAGTAHWSVAGGIDPYGFGITGSGTSASWRRGNSWLATSTPIDPIGINVYGFISNKYDPQYIADGAQEKRPVVPSAWLDYKLAVRLVRDTSPHLYVPHSGSWTKTNELHQGGGSWRKDTSLYVPHGGAWTEVAG